MATGFSKGAAARGKIVAFGDRKRIIWDQHSAQVFAGNPNIASPGMERAPNIEWVEFYKSHRIYNEQDGKRWRWNYDFKAVPGEIFLTDAEVAFGKRAGKGFILIEPNVPRWKSSAQNKDWGRPKYQELIRRLRQDGHRVVQLIYGNEPLVAGADAVHTKSFRDGLAVLRRAKLFIGPEGGLHHGAAAVGVPGVVLFGGFIPPAVTGYDMHTNLTGGAEACGSLRPCEHCLLAMSRISVNEVMQAAQDQLKKVAA